MSGSREVLAAAGRTLSDVDAALAEVEAAAAVAWLDEQFDRWTMAEDGDSFLQHPVSSSVTDAERADWEAFYAISRASNTRRQMAQVLPDPGYCGCMAGMTCYFDYGAALRWDWPEVAAREATRPHPERTPLRPRLERLAAGLRGAAAAFGLTAAAAQDALRVLADVEARLTELRALGLPEEDLEGVRSHAVTLDAADPRSYLEQIRYQLAEGETVRIATDPAGPAQAHVVAAVRHNPDGTQSVRIVSTGEPNGLLDAARSRLTEAESYPEWRASHEGAARRRRVYEDRIATQASGFTIVSVGNGS